MMRATSGDARRATSGNATAMPMMRRAAGRASTICGDDNRTTGNKVMPPMHHRDTTADCVATAARAGRTNGSTKLSSTSRRDGVPGQAVSMSAGRDGHAARKAITTGTAAKAMPPPT
jgi:hypothetical protein